MRNEDAGTCWCVVRLVAELDPKLAMQDVDALLGYLMNVRARPRARRNLELEHGNPARRVLAANLERDLPTAGVGSVLPMPGARLNGCVAAAAASAVTVIVEVVGRWCPTGPIGSRAGGGLTLECLECRVVCLV